MHNNFQRGHLIYPFVLKCGTYEGRIKGLGFEKDDPHLPLFYTIIWIVNKKHWCTKKFSSAPTKARGNADCKLINININDAGFKFLINGLCKCFMTSKSIKTGLLNIKDTNKASSHYCLKYFQSAQSLEFYYKSPLYAVY